MLWLLRVASGVVALTGLVVIVGSMTGFPVATLPVSAITPAAALLTAGFTALVAMQAAVSWTAQRRREIEVSEHSHRETVYEELLTHMTEVFTGGPETNEAQVRSKVALWASKETLEALADWNGTTYRVMQQHRGSPTPELKIELWDKYYAALASARRDLNPNIDAQTLTKDLMLGMIFDDYRLHGQGGPIDPTS